MTHGEEIHSCRLCWASEVNPPWVYCLSFNKRIPLPRCRETLRHFKIIFLASNFTLGYTQVEHESSRRFKHLFQALFRSRFRGDKVLMNRQPDAFWLGSLKDLLSAHLKPSRHCINRQMPWRTGPGWLRGGQMSRIIGCSPVNLERPGSIPTCHQVAVRSSPP